MDYQILSVYLLFMASLKTTFLVLKKKKPKRTEIGWKNMHDDHNVLRNDYRRCRTTGKRRQNSAIQAQRDAKRQLKKHCKARTEAKEKDPPKRLQETQNNYGDTQNGKKRKKKKKKKKERLKNKHKNMQKRCRIQQLTQSDEKIHEGDSALSSIVH